MIPYINALSLIVEPFTQQDTANQQHEGEGQHLRGRVALHEPGQRPRVPA